MYQQLPKHLYPETLHITAGTSYEKVIEILEASEIRYPLIVKPEVGMQGILFRKIDAESELQKYHHTVPADYVIQAFVDLPLEFSIFHIRYPDADRGKITGFLLKEYMSVVGDGHTSLLELIKSHPKAQYRMQEMRAKHGACFQMILGKGEKYVLSIAGNHNRGAKFVNLHKEIDEKLLTVIDRISIEAGSFYYGRYDIKSSSVEDLKEGRNISILEFNGTGAEPNHIYDCSMPYLTALREIAFHWKEMFNIGRINRKRGYEYWSFMKGYRFLKKSAKFFDNLRSYETMV